MAVGLDVADVTGWRLPGPDNCTSFNCTGSEMGNLFYNVLDGSAGISITTEHNANYVLLRNVKSFVGYWSVTEYATNNSNVWFFVIDDGYQRNSDKTNFAYA